MPFPATRASFVSLTGPWYLPRQRTQGAWQLRGNYVCQEFVRQSVPPLQLGILHPLGGPEDGSCSSRWPDDWHRVMGAVRDCGLVPHAIAPDNAYALTYRPTSTFPFHWDSRYKWGECVIAYSSGGPCTIKFRHIPSAFLTPCNDA
jgi:hypothetical protein